MALAAGSYDVVIAGGGPAGAATAIALAREGRRVLLVDAGGNGGGDAAHAHEGARFRVGEGLPPSARALLRELGVLERLLSDGHRASAGTVAFWGAATPHFNDFITQLHGSGLQLDRARFDASLREAAVAAGAELVESARVRVVATDTSVVTEVATAARASHQLTLCPADGAPKPIESRWLIDASGRAASLARSLGAASVRYDRLLAFYLRLQAQTPGDQDGRSWVEAVEDGWWYSVLLPSNERLVAFLCDRATARRDALLDGSALWEALRGAPNLHALCNQYCYQPGAARPRAADASSRALDKAGGSRWMAVGDAALAFDPLSSKGISNALYTGLQAARTVIAADHGDSTAVARYVAHLIDVHRVYREQLRAFYAMEQRWPDAAFWAARVASSNALHDRTVDV
ncbi:tryptophan 7-halogenase [Paraburkholderia jirisanensis]